jgi:hypothetical protein
MRLLQPIPKHHNIRPNISAATLAAIDSIRSKVVPYPPCGPDLALTDVGFSTSQETSQENSFHM